MIRAFAGNDTIAGGRRPGSSSGPGKGDDSASGRRRERLSSSAAPGNDTARRRHAATIASTVARGTTPSRAARTTTASAAARATTPSTATAATTTCSAAGVADTVNGGEGNDRLHALAPDGHPDVLNCGAWPGCRVHPRIGEGHDDDRRPVRADQDRPRDHARISGTARTPTRTPRPNSPTRRREPLESRVHHSVTIR